MHFPIRPRDGPKSRLQLPSFRGSISNRTSGLRASPGGRRLRYSHHCRELSPFTNEEHPSSGFRRLHKSEADSRFTPHIPYNIAYRTVGQFLACPRPRRSGALCEDLYGTHFHSRVFTPSQKPPRDRFVRSAEVGPIWKDRCFRVLCGAHGRYGACFLIGSTSGENNRSPLLLHSRNPPVCGLQKTGFFAMYCGGFNKDCKEARLTLGRISCGFPVPFLASNSKAPHHGSVHPPAIINLLPNPSLIYVNT